MEGGILSVNDRFSVPIPSQDLSVGRFAPVRNRLELWNETRQFLLPVMDSRSRGNDEEWSPDVLRFGKPGE